MVDVEFGEAVDYFHGCNEEVKENFGNDLVGDKIEYQLKVDFAVSAELEGFIPLRED